MYAALTRTKRQSSDHAGNALVPSIAPRAAAATRHPAWVGRAGHPPAALFGPARGLQAKRIGSETGAAYEQEADRVAEQVVQMHEASTSRPMLQRADDAGSGSSSATVYICAKDLDTSPVGRHAFFRIGAPGKGNPTISLQPIDVSLGADCWQGIPDRDYPSDLNAEGDCDPTSISVECLEREFRGYPIGHYCTWGPNSNTFVGHIARACGVANPDPSGWTPGIDESPPPAGTHAPDKWTTLAGCTTKRCIIGPDDEPDRTPRV